jgi:hypothetical protein
MTYETAYEQAAFYAAYDDALLEARIQAAWLRLVMSEAA